MRSATPIFTSWFLSSYVLAMAEKTLSIGYYFVDTLCFTRGHRNFVRYLPIGTKTKSIISHFTGL